jgi:Domain of unknown function (DUF4129)
MNMSLSTLSATQAFGVRINARAELRRALLAAAETCWVYAPLMILAALGGQARLLSPIGIFLVYWAGLEIGRYLPRVRRAWRMLQLLTLALAVALVLVVVRVDLYRGTPLLDFTWLPQYLNQLVSFSGGLTSEQIATLALLYAYVRGVGFGQRPLTLWFVGYQFRLGILVLFLTGLLGVLARSVDWRTPLIVFFVVSLLSIALARIEEGGREMALGGRWALILVGANVLVVLLGLFITPLLTIAAANALFVLLEPFAPVFEFLLNLILVPLFFILSLLFTLLGPIFGFLVAALRSFQQRLLPQLPTNAPDITRELPDLSFALPYVRLGLLLLFVFSIALIVAHALHRRMSEWEEENFMREAAGAQDLSRAERIKRPRTAAPPPREIEAENIRRIYAALLARAAAVGVPRREAETPFEFLPRLSAQFPDATPDLQTLTDAYVAVHYAQVPATGAQVREMRGVWQRLRGQLVKKRQ